MTLGAGASAAAIGHAIVVHEEPLATVDYRSGVLLPKSSPRRQSDERSDLVRRTIDILGAALLLVVALPFLVLLAIVLQIDSPGPLFFVQRRVGRDGRAFPCIKFRTMRVDAEAVLVRYLAEHPEARREWDQDFKLRDDPRITEFGGLVRKLSFDEFPQLLNIIAGHMSLVGPRPITRAEIVKYGRYYADYCRVRPGLTGLWQVSGRNDVSYERRVALDRLYVQRRSVALDLAILARTVPVVIAARGSY